MGKYTTFYDRLLLEGWMNGFVTNTADWGKVIEGSLVNITPSYGCS